MTRNACRNRAWRRRGLTLTPPLVAILLATAAGAEVGGYFAADGCHFEPTHLAAFRVGPLHTSRSPNSGADLVLVFSDRPLAGGLPYAIDPMQAALEELTLTDQRAAKGLIVTVTGSAADHFFWCTDQETGTTTQTSGHEAGAELSLSGGRAERITGVWSLAEGAGTDPALSWRFELSAAVVDPVLGAETLRRGGGEPGKAYLAFLERLREGDVAAVRRFIANPWYLAEDATAEEIAADLETMRDSQPARARVTGGLADDRAAILDVEATASDGTEGRQRVLLHRKTGSWTFGDWVPVE